MVIVTVSCIDLLTFFCVNKCLEPSKVVVCAKPITTIRIPETLFIETKQVVAVCIIHIVNSVVKVQIDSFTLSVIAIKIPISLIIITITCPFVAFCSFFILWYLSLLLFINSIILLIVKRDVFFEILIRGKFINWTKRNHPLFSHHPVQNYANIVRVKSNLFRIRPKWIYWLKWI